MKSLRVVRSVALMFFATLAFAQSDAHKPADKPVLSDAQKSFDQLKRPCFTSMGTG